MLNAVLFYRISRWCYLHHIPMIPQLVTLFIFLVYNSKIPYKAKIGKGIFFGYGGMGVVVHSDCSIGDDCIICQQVTIGGGNSRYPGVPTIGNHVYMAKGSVIIGGITIGDHVTIGANAVVNKHVPDYAVVAGVPARILRIEDEKFA